ncbi:MAG: flavodoxin domain-containing protein [Candidatus Thorarchaeota archaeon]|nr:flavodoxin domain-containing protein [Candidatus Thorarchaeota archaeon]
MTKVAICYGSRYGTTTEIVHEMVKAAEEADASVEVFELKKKQPDSVDNYDLILIGSGIQAGQWTKEPLKFMVSNLESLSNRKVALFVVCGDAGNPELCDSAQRDYLDAIAAKYPGISPVSTGFFGGMFDFKRYNFAVRTLVKSIVKKRTPKGEEVPEIIDYRDWDKIKEWTKNVVQL